MGNARVPHELRAKKRPDFEAPSEKFAVVDLFAGCGGLTLGVAQAAQAMSRGLDVRLALDIERAATEVYKANFGDADVEQRSIDELFDGELGADLTALEHSTRDRVGDLDLLVGGPPCQGHSNLNNHTRRDDPKNALYARMARAAEVLRPSFVLIENVPSVQHDISDVVGTTRAHLESMNYVVADATLSLHALGVAQKRKRHIMLASQVEGVDPSEILQGLAARVPDDVHDLKWAIADLEIPSGVTAFNTAPRASAENQRRMQYLLDKKKYDLPNPERPVCHQGNHSYTSMYGRLRWDLPAQTITSGFGSIGQGRYMHPSQARALTPHEAARIQGFPDYFDFSSVTRRSDLATMIGNAVPPALAREVVTSIMAANVRREAQAEAS